MSITLHPFSEKQDLVSRLGIVGSIQRFPLWDSRLSPEHAKLKIANIAALSYGRDEAQNPEGLFNRIRSVQHLSCFEFVPCCHSMEGALPAMSIRHNLNAFDDSPEWWGPQIANLGNQYRPGAIFLIEAPIYVARQWMRHRAFSYLEVSRRYTPPTRFNLHFYGEADPATLATEGVFWDYVRDTFDRRIATGWPLELARGCFPVETMTKFWVGGYTDNWLEILTREEERIPGFCGLRSDVHAQAEIRVFSDWIKASLEHSPGDEPYALEIDHGNV